MNGTERNMTIYEMRDNGAAFADIAREFGISTERARQIYVAHKMMEERDDTPMYKALCEAAEDAGRPYPERAASRAYHYLACRGITELAQLADYSDSQLLKIRCFGIGSLEIARAAQAKAVPTEGAQVEEPAQTWNTRAERTCTIEHRRDEYVCTACGNAVGDDDPWSENFVNGNAVEMWAYCPHCGAKVVD